MDIAIIPQPVKLSRKEGVFNLAGAAIFAAEEALETAVYAQAALGIAALNPSGSAAGRVELSLSADLERLGAEGYQLVVEPGMVSARAWKQAGLFYAVQSLRQLLPVKGDRIMPCVEIEDYPRFGWRGAMLDVCRHFFPLETVLRFIDLMALHKLNTLHWHLTDDQGWRLEIERYPRLTEVGAWRKETMVGHYEEWLETQRFDGQRHGGFYSKADVRQVLEYARQRHITVLPEIEMPGHAQAAIAAYPALGNKSEPVEVSKGWGVHVDVYNVEEATLRFLQNVLDEVIELFPSQFIHIGGDECPKEQWRENPAMQARMRELGLKDEEELQSYFVRRMDSFLFARGRRLIGWDEILEGGLAPGAAVMSWRGEDGGIAAANAGHDVVMAPNTYTYLDYFQSVEREKEPLGIGGFLPLEHVYSYEPIPAAIAEDKKHHILGAQGQLWTEYIADEKHLQYMAFPRLSALAEVAWSPSEAKDYAGFLARWKANIQPRLEAAGVNYRPLDA